MMGKSIVCLGDILTRFIEDQKITSSSSSSRQRNLCRIIIRITKDLASDYHKDSLKAAGIILVISVVVDHPPQASHLMSHNQKSMTNMGNASSIGVKMRRMSNRVIVTMRMWVTCLIRTSKQSCQCLLQQVQTLQNEIC